MPDAREPPSETCGICVYRLPDQRCHKNPPQLYGEGVGSHRGWPLVQDTDWCGAFQKITPAEERQRKR